MVIVLIEWACERRGLLSMTWSQYMQIASSQIATRGSTSISRLPEQLEAHRSGERRSSKCLVLAPFLLLAACGNSVLSCSDPESKQLLKESLANHYTDVFGQFSYVVEPGTIEANVTAITTISSDEHSANCSARASFTYQNRKALEPKAQRDIDGLVNLIGPRNTDVTYELRKTDDGQLGLRFSDLR